MTVEQLKTRFWAWYNRNIQAGWYASAALIGGWLSAAVAWIPDLLNFFLVDHGAFFGGMVFPTMSAETKAVFLSAYVTFVAPVLRAKLQTWMQKKAERQKLEARTDHLKVVIADDRAFSNEGPDTVSPEDLARSKADAGTHLGG